ncbi:heavy-metal-associated domain-containing protein [Proteiniclasticum sp. BAD-10]|uniref:Heavy-metal-associated domain-containing protein n=1 Tax=Proteiniclasticum sediminis TaxID=2804028 RepID=A0A941HQ97_9CLOT|nr:heavy-metal-associated domain-containing protein [Proteiniclasticum sediminis]
MKKVLEIEGMHCMGCVGRATRALEGLGVKAKVDLAKKNAVVEMDSDIADEVFKKALENANLELVSVSEKKSIFG